MILNAVQGVPSAFTQKDAENIGTCTILDGNYRVAVLKRIKGDDFLVPPPCYSNIQNVNVDRIVAEGGTIECENTYISVCFLF